MQTNELENKQAENNAEGTKPMVSAHELARKMVEDKDYHVSEEDMKSIDTSSNLSDSEEEVAGKMAEDLEKDRPIVPQEVVGQ